MDLVTRDYLIKFKDEYLPRFYNSNNSIAHHLNFLRKVYRHAKNKGRINKIDIPEFPSVSKKPGKVSYLKEHEYRKLVQKSIERMNKQGLARNAELVRKAGIIYYLINCCRTETLRPTGYIDPEMCGGDIFKNILHPVSNKCIASSELLV